MSKGHIQRPVSVAKDEFDANWDNTFRTCKCGKREPHIVEMCRRPRADTATVASS